MTSGEVATFLGIVQRDRAARCEALLGDAGARSAELLAEARRDARRRVAAAVADDRARGRRRIEAARAELMTRERRLDQDVATKLLARAWKQLRSTLSSRWQHPESRTRWVRSLLSDAARLLPRGTWRIQHPPGFAELELLRGTASRLSGAEPVLEPAPDVAAGLRVHVAGATLDGTLEGLIADRRRVEGRLLHELSPTGNGGAT